MIGCNMASTYCMYAVLEQMEIKSFFLFKGTIVNIVCLIPPSSKEPVRKWPSYPTKLQVVVSPSLTFITINYT